jgi:hypothetical protein
MRAIQRNLNVPNPARSEGLCGPYRRQSMPFYFDPDVHFIERHDPDPLRLYRPQDRAAFESDLARKKALVDAWRDVPMALRLRAIEAGWFRRR